MKKYPNNLNKQSSSESRKLNETLENTSPCIGRCCLNEENICLGCFRNIDEILAWSTSSTQEKKKILALCESRKKH